MSGQSLTPAQTGFSRVFLIEGSARPDHAPSYQSFLAAGSVSQAFGDVTKIEAPDPSRYGKYKELGTIRGAEERATTSLVGRYAADLKSTMLELAKRGCPVDLQIHLGSCQDPSQFNKFDKAIVLKNALITNWSTGDVGALASDGQAVVDETAELSATDIIEILPLQLSQVASSMTTKNMIAVTISDTVSCGGCESESIGCQKIFALSIDAGGSPSTPADVVFSLDAGSTWYAHDVEGATDDPTGIAVVGDYLVVTSNIDACLFYVDKSDMNSYTDPTFLQVTTGVVTGGEPNAIWSVGTYAFVVGDGGYIYGTADPTAGLTVLDAGAAHVDNYRDVHALDQDFAVAVGDAGRIAYTENGTTWTALTTSPVSVGVVLNCVWVHSEKVWMVGTSTGRLYYTTDKGVTWSEKTFTGSGSGSVDDIAFSDSNVGYMVHTTGAVVGRVLRTYDGGYSWQVLPEGTGTTVMNQGSAVAACADNPNIVVAVGLDSDAATGAILLGNIA